jgi:hypothetical protein
MTNKITSALGIENWKSAMPKTKHIAAILSGMQEADEQEIARASDRASNYSNCVDDYSYGGVQDRYAERSRQARDRARVMLKAIAAGEDLTGIYEHYYIADYSGNFLSDTVVDGMYGKSWVISGPRRTWVSLAKNASTYAKKGYKLMCARYAYTYYPANNDGEWNIQSIVTSVTISEVVGKAAYQLCMPDHIYAAINS